MFIVFLAAMAVVVSLFLGALLLRRDWVEPPLQVPWRATAVVMMAAGLVAWGLSIL